jgi:hypothetical protein
MVTVLSQSDSEFHGNEASPAVIFDYLQFQ